MNKKPFYVRRCFAVPGSQLFLDFHDSEARRIGFAIHSNKREGQKNLKTAIGNIGIARHLSELPEERERRRLRSKRMNYREERLRTRWGQ